MRGIGKEMKEMQRLNVSGKREREKGRDRVKCSQYESDQFVL